MSGGLLLDLGLMTFCRAASNPDSTSSIQRCDRWWRPLAGSNFVNQEIERVRHTVTADLLAAVSELVDGGAVCLQ